MELFNALEKYYYNFILPNKDMKYIYNIELQEAYLFDNCSDTIKNRKEVTTYCKLIKRINLLEIIFLNKDYSSLYYKKEYSDIINERYYLSIINFLNGLNKQSRNKKQLQNSNTNCINYHDIKLNFLGENEFNNFKITNDYITFKVNKDQFDNNLNMLVRKLKLRGKRTNKTFHGFLINNNEIYALFIKK